MADEEQLPAEPATTVSNAAEAEPWPDPIFTVSLIVANVAIFFVMVARGVSFWTMNELQSLQWGANVAALTLGGQYWRLFTANFLHIGFIHLAFNMVMLFLLGRLAEYFYSSKDFLLLYAYAGLCSGLVGGMWQPYVTSAGASGAIFGISGAMLATLWRGDLPIEKEDRERVLSGVIQFTVLNLFIGGVQNYLPGIFHARVDSAGHIGGLLGGLLVGTVVGNHLSDGDGDKGHRRRAWLLLYLGFFLVLICAVFYWQGVSVHVQRGLPASR